jgi:hypothetical protein
MFRNDWIYVQSRGKINHSFSENSEVRTMPARRLKSKPHRRGVPPAAESGRAQLSRTLKAIETERDNLSRAQSLLECMKAAMEYAEVDHRGPYYPDLLQMATGIVRKSINALDPINLPSLSRDKVREEFLANDATLLLIAHAELPLLPRRAFAPPRRFSLRVHRRNYSRVSARNASRLDSASANIAACLVR